MTTGYATLAHRRDALTELPLAPLACPRHTAAWSESVPTKCARSWVGARRALSTARRRMPLPLQFFLLLFAGWVNRRQEAVIEYLNAENRVLRELHGDTRLLFTDAQRRRLKKGTAER